MGVLEKEMEGFKAFQCSFIRNNRYVLDVICIRIELMNRSRFVSILPRV